MNDKKKWQHKVKGKHKLVMIFNNFNDLRNAVINMVDTGFIAPSAGIREADALDRLSSNGAYIVCDADKEPKLMEKSTEYVVNE